MYFRRKILEALPVLAVLQAASTGSVSGSDTASTGSISGSLFSIYFAYTAQDDGVRYCGNWQPVGVQYCSYCQYSDLFRGFSTVSIPSASKYFGCLCCRCCCLYLGLMHCSCCQCSQYFGRQCCWCCQYKLAAFRPSVLLMMSILAVFSAVSTAILSALAVRILSIRRVCSGV